MATVVTCSACERFVYTSHASCPFCDTPRVPSKVSSPRRNLSRAAIVALALAGGCSSNASTTAPPEDPAPENVEDTSGGTTPETEDAGEGSGGESEGGEYAEDPDAEDDLYEDAPVPAYGVPPGQ